MKNVAKKWEKIKREYEFKNDLKKTLVSLNEYYFYSNYSYKINNIINNNYNYKLENNVLVDKDDTTYSMLLEKQNQILNYLENINKLKTKDLKIINEKANCNYIAKIEEVKETLKKKLDILINDFKIFIDIFEKELNKILNQKNNYYLRNLIRFLKIKNYLRALENMNEEININFFEEILSFYIINVKNNPQICRKKENK